MAEKFTFEKHQEMIEQILAQAEPVKRTGILSSLLERARGTQPTEARPPRLPQRPKLPRM